VLNVSDATLAFGGEKIELTKNEYRILQLLMENKGQIVPRDATSQSYGKATALWTKTP
jgi:DNA-binding response OmpR family regulator